MSKDPRYKKTALSSVAGEVTESRNLIGRRDIMRNKSVTFDTRRRNNTTSPSNAADSRIEYKFPPSGCQKFEVTHVILPKKGSENQALLRLQFGQTKMERGETDDGAWYTAIIPLANPDASTNIVHDINTNLRTIYWFTPVADALRTEVLASLVVFDPTTRTYVPYPLADDDFDDPLENFTFTLEFTNYE